MKNFLSLKNCSVDEILSLLSEAKRLEQNPGDLRLQGKVLGLLFMNPSVRTLASFQSAMARLGGTSFVIAPGTSSWGMEWRDNAVMNEEAAEHFREAIPVLEEYADALGLRCFARGENLAEDMSEPILNVATSLAKKPFINMESAMDHPCQSLADWKTMDDLGIDGNGKKFVLSWADHPKALPLAVPSATLDMAVRRGMDVTVLAPDGFELPASMISDAKALADSTGASVTETTDRREALSDATVLYAKAWRSPIAYGDEGLDQELRTKARLDDWTIRESWFESASPGARFMHCLPVRRNVVVADEILDGPRSIVTKQARNRLYAQMSVLCHLLLEN
ncbi:MAG: N-acetylornithine carbamoyltransferase [Planctomycetota bacterium]|jgi:N-acetylornithine carbamoyltransferase